MRRLLCAVVIPGALVAQTASVARINVTPTSPSVVVGQTLQLRAEAVDGSGRIVAGATVRFQRGGSPFEGGVDAGGLVSAGAPGVLVVNVTAIVEGQRPAIQRIEIPARAGPAATIEIEPRPVRLLATQEVVLRTRVLSANSDDPAHPKQVATWEVPRTVAGRYLHDVEVTDGLLYASYLNDGLVILDVGNGIKGGSPSNPQLVSQFKYDLVARRYPAEASGTTVIGGTHTEWRYKNYVFVGDEILPLRPSR